MTFTQIVKQFKFGIASVLIFVLIENVAWIVEPTFFGSLLDALIDHFYNKEVVNYYSPLFIWIFIYLVNVLGGTMSRLLSGRVYSRMYADIATRVIVNSKNRDMQLLRSLQGPSWQGNISYFLRSVCRK